MMAKARKVLLDTGPLVAFFNPRDHHHAEAAAFFQALGSGTCCYTTWEVVSEAMYLLNYSAHVQAELLEWLHRGHMAGLMRIAAVTPEELPDLARLVRKYADRPMDLADATPVHLANRENITDVATIDRSDFDIYRTGKGKAFRNVLSAG